MLDGLKRLFTRPARVPAKWDPVVAWADQHRHGFRTVGDDEGFVVEGQFGSQAWRLEWGPSQRPYVSGNELRLRAEGGVPPEVQAMVLDRALQAAMERQMFDQYVESVQTRIDDSTPPEMRWLVMLNKLEGAELGALRQNFAAVAGGRGWIRHWLEGPLTQALLAAPLAGGQPLVLMVARGRVTLRTEMPDPSPAALEAMLRLFAVAVHEARRASTQADAHDEPSTQASDWPAPGASLDGPDAAAAPDAGAAADPGKR